MVYKKKIDINLYVAQMSLPPRYRRCTIAPLLFAIRVTDILAQRNPMLWCGVAQTYRQNLSARGPKLQINDHLAIFKKLHPLISVNVIYSLWYE